MKTVKFKTSGAGEAGDTTRLLTVEYDGKFYSWLYTDGSLRSMRRAKRKILEKIELDTGQRVKE